MQNQYCLNLDLGFVVDSSILDTIDVDPSRVNHFVIKNIDKKLTDFLSSLGIAVPYAEIFYTPPLRILPLHVDGDYLSNFCKLNFIFGGEGSLMQWWELKDKDVPLNYHINKNGTRYLRIETNECEFVWQEKVGQPGLVNIGRPHQVVNCTNTPRWCMSYCLYDNINKGMLQWENASKIFEQYQISSALDKQG